MSDKYWEYCITYYKIPMKSKIIILQELYTSADYVAFNMKKELTKQGYHVNTIELVPKKNLDAKLFE